MSRPDFTRQEPFEATLVADVNTGTPRPQHSSSWLVWIGCIVVIAAPLTAIVVAGAAFLGHDVTDMFGSTDYALPQAESPDQKWAIVSAAFGQPTINVSEEDLQTINDSIGKILHEANEENYDAVRAMIDVTQFIRRVEQDPETSQLMFADRLSIRTSFADVTDGPTGLANFRIVSALNLNEHHLVVYMYLWDDTEYIEEARWWFVRRGTTWKLYDWETLATGMSEAQVYAALYEHYEEPDVQAYYSCIDDVSEAVDWMNESNYETAEQKLDQAEQYVIHSSLHDNAMHYVATYWTYTHNWDAVARLLPQDPRPGIDPLAPTTTLRSAPINWMTISKPSNTPRNIRSYWGKAQT